MPAVAVGEIARAFLARHMFVQAGRGEAAQGSRFAVNAAEVARTLGATDGEQVRARAASADAVCARKWDDFRRDLPPPLATLATSLGLSDVDLQLIVALAAIELEPEMERAYAFAWDDFTRKRPDVGFLARLVGGPTDDGQNRTLRALEGDQPLRRHRVIVLAGDGPFVMRQVRLADRVVAHLLGHAVLDDAIASFCRVAPPVSRADVVLDADLLDRLARALAGPAPRVLLYGPDGTGKAMAVEAIAADHGRPALRADLEAVLGERDRLADRIAACGREAALRGAVLIAELGPDVDTAKVARPLAERLGELLDGLPVPLVVCATSRPSWLLPHVPSMIELEVPAPSYRQRIELWRRALPAGAVDADVELVAGRYAFTGAAITRAARRARSSAQLRDGDHAATTLDDLGEAARLMFSHHLGDVAQRIPAGFTWDDLVLPPDTHEQIREVVRFARQRPFLLEEWGFARKLPYGRGVSAILSGPPGTGKTMVAQLLARELGYDLFRIDLSQVVNKYIGETEKNLARIFREAENSHAVLFFDEADALFAKRTEVRSSNDRYANLEVNFLLQRMETYDGVTLLATNLEQGLDEAFKRRVRFSIQFELPDAAERERLWRSMFPPQAPLAPDIDWGKLAATFEMAGGYIKKAVLRAALAAADAQPRRPVSGADLFAAARSEYREMGRIVPG
jgi:AAA+ superfamily predicted ATPase